MFDPKPGQMFRHYLDSRVTVLVIGWDEVSSKIAPSVRCAQFLNGVRGPDRSIWLDKLHEDYSPLS